MGEMALRCLESVRNQEYERQLVRHIFIDDASTDSTPEIVNNWLQEHPDHRVTFIRNTERVGMLANNLAGFRLADDDDIGIELNGDDWLPDHGVLRFLNKVYDDDDVWMTYNTHRRITGEIPLPLALKRSVIVNRRFRKSIWVTSALHTFRMALYRHLETASLIDPDTGEPWEFSQDQAVYLPMLEMAGPHSRHIYRITLIYNFHERSDENRHRSEQLEMTRRIRALPPYPELSSIDD
jgi:glycosyltransferase involved in cell wall biosynthesis